MGTKGSPTSQSLQLILSEILQIEMVMANFKSYMQHYRINCIILMWH
jgi:hypothetical protein